MSDLSDLVRYSAWASQKLLRFAQTVPLEDVERAIGNSHGGILKTFHHIYYADRIWTARMARTDIPSFEDPAPGPSLLELETAWWPLLDRLAEVAQTTPAEQITQFRRMNGDACSLPFGELIQHVVNHGTYHRGQIASILRQSGHVPPSTDFLYYRLNL